MAFRIDFWYIALTRRGGDYQTITAYKTTEGVRFLDDLHGTYRTILQKYLYYKCSIW